MSAELRRLLAEATPGPWHRGTTRTYGIYSADADPEDQRTVATVPHWDGSSHLTPIDSRGDADAALIVAAVNALPDLLDRIDALEAVVDAARAIVVGVDRLGTATAPTFVALRVALDQLDPPVTEGPITDANGDELEHGADDPGSLA